MKVYLAGKITGDEEYREKFCRAAEKLEKKHHEVINPAWLPDGMRPQDYMQICLPMLFTADMAAFLPDWEESSGARLEYELCIYIDKPIFLLEE